MLKLVRVVYYNINTFEERGPRKSSSVRGVLTTLFFSYQRITVQRVSYGPPREVITVNLENFARISFFTNLRRSKFATEAHNIFDRITC